MCSEELHGLDEQAYLFSLNLAVVAVPTIRFYYLSKTKFSYY